MTDAQFSNYFERVYVINLKQRPERLAEFRKNIEAAKWPFVEPCVYGAIHGDTVGVPDEFKEGGGAFGCRQSHTRILEECMMDGVQGLVLVLEDDAVFRTTFAADCRAFLELVEQHAKDAEGLMLGGQNHSSPIPLKPNVKGLKRSRNTQRTHAYACRGSYMRELYRRWAGCSVHIDWLMSDFHHKHKVYQPDVWLVGQAGGMSDIRGAVKPPEWWISPSGDEPVVLLDAPKEVAEALRAKHGLHFGYNRDPKTNIDADLPKCFGPNVNRREQNARLRTWLWGIAEECHSVDGLLATVFHPGATIEQVRESWKGPVYHVQANTVEEALRQLPANLVKPKTRQPADRVLLFSGPTDVLEDLRGHGFHCGYWRGDDGIDNGLREIFDAPEAERIDRLTRWFGELQREADSFYGVVTVYHPQATVELLRQATDLRVVTITADTITEALEQWRGQQ